MTAFTKPRPNTSPETPDRTEKNTKSAPQAPQETAQPRAPFTQRARTTPRLRLMSALWAIWFVITLAGVSRRHYNFQTDTYTTSSAPPDRHPSPARSYLPPNVRSNTPDDGRHRPKERFSPQEGFSTDSQDWHHDAHQPPAHETPVPLAPAMSHHAVRAFLSLLQKRQRHIEIVLCTAERPERHRILCEVTRIASTSQAAKLKVVRTFCPACHAWHDAEADPDNPALAVPQPDHTYYEMSMARPDILAAVVVPDCDDVGSDLDPADFAEPDPDASRARQRAEDMMFAEPMSHVPIAGRISACRKWHVYPTIDRPPHVHRAVWMSRSQATRNEHARWLRRIATAPAELDAMRLDKAVVEIVMRMATERRWAASTVASKLSAAKSALASLSVYTNVNYDIHLDSVYFAQAMEAAQKRARIAAITPAKSRALTFDEFHALARSVSGDGQGAHTFLLAHVSWWLAARVGDARRLQAEHVAVAPAETLPGWTEVRARFTRGKGAYFWGPYTVVSCFPTPVARALSEHVRAQRGADNLFAPRDQAALAAAVRVFPDASLRSLRKGALTHYALKGVGDANLRLLSGHRRADTLLRYLGFGWASEDHRKAAAARAEALHNDVSGGAPEEPVTGTAPPTKMGRRSGFGGTAGRRTKAPPTLFGHKAPSREDLGIKAPAVDRSAYTLHVKPEVKPVSEEKVKKLADGLPIADALKQAWSLITSTAAHFVPWPPLTLDQLPPATFSNDDWLKMLAAGKCIPARVNGTTVSFVHGDKVTEPMPLVSGCRGFSVPQDPKARWRPVFEPLHNSSLDRDRLPPLKYPHRAERRRHIATRRYRIEFDFSAWYDQFELHPSLWSRHVVRTATPVLVNGELFTAFALTRAPMGATWSAHLAQTVTWTIVATSGSTPA
jgi:hypothetical protein